MDVPFFTTFLLLFFPPKNCFFLFDLFLLALHHHQQFRWPPAIGAAGNSRALIWLGFSVNKGSSAKDNSATSKNSFFSFCTFFKLHLVCICVWQWLARCGWTYWAIELIGDSITAIISPPSRRIDVHKMRNNNNTNNNSPPPTYFGTSATYRLVQQEQQQQLRVTKRDPIYPCPGPPSSRPSPPCPLTKRARRKRFPSLSF